MKEIILTFLIIAGGVGVMLMVMYFMSKLAYYMFPNNIIAFVFITLIPYMLLFAISINYIK